MEIIQAEWTCFDKEKSIVEKTYSVDKKIVAKLVFDFKSNETKIEGNLFDLLGYNDSEKHKIMYNKLIEVEKWMSKQLLEKI